MQQLASTIKSIFAWALSIVVIALASFAANEIMRGGAESRAGDTFRDTTDTWVRERHRLGSILTGVEQTIGIPAPLELENMGVPATDAYSHLKREGSGEGKHDIDGIVAQHEREIATVVEASERLKQTLHECHTELGPPLPEGNKDIRDKIRNAIVAVESLNRLAIDYREQLQKSRQRRRS